ncbi:MAG: ribosomal protein L24, partial [Candidatus Nanosalina sp. J07AB43]
LSHNLRNELDTRNLGIRNGDRVKVMRGDRKGAEGIVNQTDRENERIFIDGVEKEAVDGSVHQIPLRPSNVQIVSLNLSDENRLDKYEVSDFEAIKVDDEEVEEALEEDDEEEMMQQLQGGESGAHEQFEEDEDEPETEDGQTEDQEDQTEDDEPESAEDSELEDSEDSVNYDEAVSGTVSEAKDEISDMEDPDFEALLRPSSQVRTAKP